MDIIDKEIDQYCQEHSWKPSEPAGELAQYTQQNVSMSRMLIGSLEASLLGFLIRSGGAKRVLEFGCFTGYSALAMAENLPEDGELITLDVNEETTELARSFWKKSPYGKKINAVLGPALESLQKIEGSFDFVFIDADKENYPQYLELSLERLSENGVIVADNALQNGRVLDPKSESKAAQTLREFNQRVIQDKSLFCSLVPLRDGMMLIRKC